MGGHKRGLWHSGQDWKFRYTGRVGDQRAKVSNTGGSVGKQYIKIPSNMIDSREIKIIK